MSGEKQLLASSHVGQYDRLPMPEGLPAGCREFLSCHMANLTDCGGGEWRFVVNVLSKIGGLDWSAVKYQFPFVDTMGNSRRIDFVIFCPSGRKIALEVDGWDKKQTGRGMDRADFNDFLMRQNSLIAAGFDVLRFSNEQVIGDPVFCVGQIYALLSRESVKLRSVPKVKQSVVAARPARSAAPDSQKDAVFWAAVDSVDLVGDKPAISKKEVVRADRSGMGRPGVYTQESSISSRCSGAVRDNGFLESVDLVLGISPLRRFLMSLWDFTKNAVVVIGSYACIFGFWFIFLYLTRGCR